jgi:hypothetical protein
MLNYRPQSRSRRHLQIVDDAPEDIFRRLTTDPLGVGTDGQHKLLVHCRSGCSQDKVIEAIDELGLWDCTRETIDALNEATISTSSAGTTQKPTRKSSVAIVPVPANAPKPPDQHYDLGPMTNRWAYRSAAGELVFYVYRFEPNPTWEKNFAQAAKSRTIE